MNFKFLIVLSFFISSAVYAEHCRKIEPGVEVSLFVDTNASFAEVETAKKAACKQGKAFLVVPKEYKEIGLIRQKKLHLKRKMKKYCGDQHYSMCTHPKAKELNDLDKKIFSLAQRNMDQQLEQAMKKVKDSNGKLKDFLISGHNGGGNF
jgi:hypothetical protein